MSAITGVVDFNNNPNKILVENMLEVMKHRGPDNRVIHIDDNIGLGFRGSKNIISNKNKTIFLACDGDIYDSEDGKSILDLYEKTGLDFLKDLEGDFAFIIWDLNKKSLFLVRNRMGTRPLYYTINNNKILFASEIKAILEDKNVERKVNERAVKEYFTFQDTLGDKTFFENIFHILPGHYAIFNENGLEIKQYWDYTPNTQVINKESVIDEFKIKFKDSVRKCLHKDDSVGCFLSGGFDSSSIALEAAEQMNNKLLTFSGYFKEGIEYDETKYSQAVSEKINSESHKILIESDEFEKNIRKIIWHLDEPKVGMGAFSQFIVSKYARDHIKIALCGEGGDELFLGYASYVSDLLRDEIKRNPLIFFKYPRKKEFIKFIYHWTKSLISQDEVYHMPVILFSEKERKNMFVNKDSYDVYFEIKKLLSGLGKTTKLDEATYIFVKTHLPSLFVVDDKIYMANAIETRFPMADNSLVDFIRTVPNNIKLSNFETKYIIKEGMRNRLPDILYEHKKMGFPTPLNKWFTNELKDFVYKTFDENAMIYNYINKDFVNSIIEDHMKNKKDNASKIWSLISFEIWLQLFIRGDKI